MARFAIQAIVAAGLGAAGALALTGGGHAPSNSATPGQTCNIKGNISVSTGERIYHMPGQTYYSDTKIDARFGERWFCSEGEARAAGWRRSKV
jgi:hypothetical protein